MSDLIMESIHQLGSNMPGGFFVYKADETEEILYANEIVPDIFGCASIDEFRELTGFTFRGLVLPEDLDRVEKGILDQVAGNTNQLDYVEYRIRRRDGSIRWVDDYGRLVHTEQFGDVYYVLIRDITEIKAQREENLRMELELEKEKNVNEVKSAFLFNISHDIRTPMNAIKGFTDLAILHIDEPEKLRDYLMKVEESNQHMISLIENLLEMSKPDYWKYEVREDCIDLKDALKTAIDMQRKQMEDKGLELVVEDELPDQKVYIDEPRFQRIMGNLLQNAVKFTPAGGKITLSASRKQVSDSGYARYEFSVADTGIGMTEEFMQRMFQAFEREETSTRSGYIGTGLGLAITKKMLDLMGGSISVESTKGKGSVFTVGLPLKLADHTPKQEVITGGGQDACKAAGEYRILLVEDIEINRMLAESILESAGFLVESVPDGSDAVEAFLAHDGWYYDLILMDIQMPVMNGYEATRRIRAMEREDAKEIPIIALSANARDEDKRESLESGMNSHLAKPFDLTLLINTLNEHIDATKRRHG